MRFRAAVITSVRGRTLDNGPGFRLRERRAFLDEDQVSSLARVVLVMRPILLRAANGLLEQRVGEAALHTNRDRLVVGVAHHNALQYAEAKGHTATAELLRQHAAPPPPAAAAPAAPPDAGEPEDSAPASLPLEIYESARRGELQKVVKWVRKEGLVDALCPTTTESGKPAAFGLLHAHEIPSSETPRDGGARRVVDLEELVVARPLGVPATWRAPREGEEGRGAVAVGHRSGGGIVRVLLDVGPFGMDTIHHLRLTGGEGGGFPRSSYKVTCVKVPRGGGCT